MLAGLIALAQIWRTGMAAPASAAFGILLPLLMLAWPAHLRAGLHEAAAHQRRHHRLAAPPRSWRSPSARRRANPAPIRASVSPRSSRRPIPTCAPWCSIARWRRPSSWSRRPCASCKWRVAAAEPPTGKAARRAACSRRPTRRWWSASPTTSSSAWRAAPPARASTCAPPRATASRPRPECDARAPLPRRAAGARRRHRRPASPAGAGCARRGRGAPVKKVKGRDPQKAESRNGRDRAQSNAQRGRGQKETLR